MKKFLVMLSAVVVVLTSVCITAFAATEDIELSVVRATLTNGKWGQSVTYSTSDFDPTRMTPDSQIFIEYEIDGELASNGWHPAELILQNYVIEPQIWVQVAPVEFDEDSAVFNYADMVAAYSDKGGAEDLSDVNNLCIGDAGVPVKVTKVTVTNCSLVETTTTEATTAETAAETEEVTEAETTVTEVETTAKTPEDSEDSEDNIITIVIIIAVAVVVIAAVIVTVVVVKKNRRRFY